MQFIFRKFLVVCSMLAIGCTASAQITRTPVRMLNQTAGRQQTGSNVFAPISKYMVKGDADALSAWFADNLEISILSQGGDASKAQARQIIRSFFASYTPRAFVITHTAGQGTMKYALADLNAGGESFRVTVFVNCRDDGYRIQQLKIERP